MRLSVNHVDFKLVQLIIANRFLIKHKRYNGTHTHYTDILPWKPKPEKLATCLESHL
jgi:hypothetical protein